MRRKSIACLLLLGAARIGAQTTVTTTSGASGTVPVFSGSSTIVNSPISVSGTKVGLNAPAQLSLSLGPNGTGINVDSTYVIGILTGGTERFQLNGNNGLMNLNNSMTVTGTGNVGIGTTSPAAPLDFGGAVGVKQLWYGSGGNLGYYWGTGLNLGQANNEDSIFIGGASGASGGAANFSIITANQNSWPYTSYTTRFVLNSQTGNVGIGTTTPTQTLSVNGSISATSGTGSGGLYFRTVGGSQNTAVSPILLTEGVLSGNGSAATPWGLNLVSAPWSWGEDPMTYHAGIHLFRIAGANTAETEVVQINSGGLSIDSGFSLNFADGTKQSTAWTGVLCGGDYAESVDVSGGLTKNEPGDLLVIDPDTPDKFVKSMEPYSSAIAGVYSTKPGVVGRHQTTPKSEDEVPMAVVGIVTVKVSAENGPIRPRDLLVSASTPGYAMKGTDRSRMLGAIVGKAMGSLDSGTGVINVLVTLQ